MHSSPVAPQHRYRAKNQRQPSSSSISELAASSSRNMAPPSSDSEPPCITQRPSEERAPEAGTSSESNDDQAAEASRRPTDEPAPMEEAEKKKDNSSAATDAAAGSGDCFGAEPARRPAAAEESARERLKRHRTEMAGRVRIPDMWGQERLLKDWVDCAVFDRPLAATAGLLNARDALVAECAAARRATGRPLRVQNGCS